jgi:hypothetical protein
VRAAIKKAPAASTSKLDGELDAQIARASGTLDLCGAEIVLLQIQRAPRGPWCKRAWQVLNAPIGKVLEGNVPLGDLPEEWHAAWREVGPLQAHRAIATLEEAATMEAPLRQSLEAWYDDAMKRVTGWYKRRTQVLLWVIGGVAVGLMNADTLWMANYLSRDSTARASIVAAAERGTRNPGLDPTPGAPPAPGVDDPHAASAALGGTARIMAELQQLHLPLGWFPPRLSPLMEEHQRAKRELDDRARSYATAEAKNDQLRAEVDSATERFDSAKASITPRRMALVALTGETPELKKKYDEAVTALETASMNRAAKTRALAAEERTLAELKVAADLAAKRMASAEAALQAAQAQQSEAGRLPLLPKGKANVISWGAWLAWFADWLEKLAGLFLTVAALSLGAPFWFDLLKQFMNVRTAGVRPETAAAERQAAAAPAAK